MVIVRLAGGLGNQMFQYAFARHLSEKNKAKLKIDTSYFESQHLRKYELGIFNISGEIISKKEFHKYFPLPTKQPHTKLLNKLRSIFCSFTLISEKHPHFSPDIFTSTGNVYINYGYWQSEKYFKPVERLIRNEFKFKTDTYNQHLKSQIMNSNSISIHIRRGDYVTDPKTNIVHGTCGIDYYGNAISYIGKKIESPVFYVFSDDINWVKKNLPIPFEHYFIENKTNYEDMQLMSNCKHNIIANSSFSWWGAWLNNNVNKIIVAPAKWYNDPTKNSPDIIPDSWIKL